MSLKERGDIIGENEGKSTSIPAGIVLQGTHKTLGAFLLLLAPSRSASPFRTIPAGVRWNTLSFNNGE
jgi:hypothetical protein